MLRALTDVPRCLNLEACYVGPPHRIAAPPGAWERAWGQPSREGGTQAFRRQAVQECLDTVAVLRSYREPLEGETWLIPAGSERRLLAQVNAIVALGPAAVAQVADAAIDGDVPDPARVFAALFILGCVEGRAWLQTMQLIFVSAVVRHPGEAMAAVEAMGLAPNPELSACMEPLLSDDRPRLRAAALRVLAYRGVLKEDSWRDAMQETDAGVLHAAACAPLRGYERGHCDRAIEPLLAQSSEALVAAALRAGLGLRSAAAHSRASAIVREGADWADAPKVLAMFGYTSDVRHIRPMIHGPRWSAGVKAAARLGCVGLVPDLLELLEEPALTPEALVQARAALQTITGAPFEATGSAAEAWQLWTERSPAFHPDARYRFGHGLDLQALLHALKAPPGSREARQDTYLEMLAASEWAVPRFSAYDFVGVQTACIRRIEQWLAESRDRVRGSHLLH